MPFDRGTNELSFATQIALQRIEDDKKKSSCMKRISHDSTRNA